MTGEVTRSFGGCGGNTLYRHTLTYTTVECQ